MMADVLRLGPEAFLNQLKHSNGAAPHFLPRRCTAD